MFCMYGYSIKVVLKFFKFFWNWIIFVENVIVLMMYYMVVVLKSM